MCVSGKVGRGSRASVRLMERLYLHGTGKVRRDKGAGRGGLTIPETKFSRRVECLRGWRRIIRSMDWVQK